MSLMLYLRLLLDVVLEVAQELLRILATCAVKTPFSCIQMHMILLQARFVIHEECGFILLHLLEYSLILVLALWAVWEACPIKGRHNRQTKIHFQGTL